MTFGRKRVEPQGHVGFDSLIAAYRATQTTQIETRQDTRERLRMAVSLREEQIPAFVESYNERVRRAEQRLELAVQPIRQHLFRSGVTWDIEPSFLLAPEMWKGGKLTNTLIYGLGLTPHDFWNRVITTNHPIAAVDLGLRVYDRDIQLRLTREFEERQAKLVIEYARLEQVVDESGDIEPLALFVCDWRDRLDIEFARMRADV